MNYKEEMIHFVDQVIAQSNYERMDQRYLLNQILGLVGEGNADKTAKASNDNLISMKDDLIELAIQNQQIDDSQGTRDVLGARLMDFITPPPSEVNRTFWQHYDAKGPEVATDYFYRLCKDNDYIKTKAIAKNIIFTSPTTYGDLEITINLSKPEKDPKQIALAKKMPDSGYPLCQLCMENEGYIGRVNYPARSNHRIIRLNLTDEEWGFQYSPYAYFNEHCIFLDHRHEPMTINRKTFIRLLAIIDRFPHYFVGSNADLPIVGGSILSHEHYQGGRHDFPMAKAPIEKPVSFQHFEKIKAGIVKWPMSVIRLTGADKEKLIDLSEKILDKWRHYSDESVGVRAETNGEPHHTITPIARRRGQLYEFDLVLRDNQTSEKYPLGIFHPHPDVQHIKKENIGLIEVMGRAILPPRLKPELKEVVAYVLGKENQMKDYHKDWADRIKQHHPELNVGNAEQIVNQEVGKVFGRVLEDAGVYKRDEKGQTAFMRFLQSI
ncbi:UDP-glucose--hexose-1-phosphate uridylyltransferase [Sporolactobacillus pectinivorans]|uniref:UDP-glucose--hexose-1-phosphate uridylyltransferase n=1 Tax=Sporolactobacillus pectinivorans TaxID=1591408 RepID=UPI000C264CDA|nr:UDP-glucose--hexose-1-phosphate uridylyltransferase [Sporolactobacillus pectinivorans]